MNRYRDSLSVGDAARLSELLAVLLLAGFSSPSPPLSVSSSLSLSVSLSSSLGGWRIGRRRISRCVGWEEREREREWNREIASGAGFPRALSGAVCTR